MSMDVNPDDDFLYGDLTPNTSLEAQCPDSSSNRMVNPDDDDLYGDVVPNKAVESLCVVFPPNRMIKSDFNLCAGVSSSKVVENQRLTESSNSMVVRDDHVLYGDVVPTNVVEIQCPASNLNRMVNPDDDDLYGDVVPNKAVETPCVASPPNHMIRSDFNLCAGVSSSKAVENQRPVESSNSMVVPDDDELYGDVAFSQAIENQRPAASSSRTVISYRDLCADANQLPCTSNRISLHEVSQHDRSKECTMTPENTIRGLKIVNDKKRISVPEDDVVVLSDNESRGVVVPITDVDPQRPGTSHSIVNPYRKIFNHVNPPEVSRHTRTTDSSRTPVTGISGLKIVHERKRRSVPEDDLVVLSGSSEDIMYDGTFPSTSKMPKKKRKRRSHRRSSSTSSSSSEHDEMHVDFPFAKGRNHVEVEDAYFIVSDLVMLIRDVMDDLLTSTQAVFKLLGKMVSPNRRHLDCAYCKKAGITRDEIVYHYTSDRHMTKVIECQEVFSAEQDYFRFVRLCQKAKAELIDKKTKNNEDLGTTMPFMFGVSKREASKLTINECGDNYLSFEKIYNRINAMKNLKLLSNGFYVFLSSKFPGPQVGKCKYCAVEYNSIKHFLEMDHIVKVMHGGYVFTTDWHRLKEGLQRYLHKLGYTPKNARKILWDIEKASREKYFSKESQEFNDFKDRI